MAVMDWGWQGKTGKLRRRGQYVFRNNSIPADIVFRVRNKEGDVEEILAHKVLMAMGSNVFEEKLYGSNMEALDQMTITNHRADAFRIVLQYLYSDRAPGLNAENAMAVMRCAEEYHIADLVVECQMQMLQELRTLAAANDVLFAMVKISEPTSRQSLVSANVGQEKEEPQDEKAKGAAGIQFTLQIQALMNSGNDPVQAVSMSKKTEFEEIDKTVQDSSTTDVVRSLATPKTGWEPNHGKGLGGLQPEELENDKILSEVRALLDKITPNNYVRLSNRMLEIPFTKTGELLTAVADAIFAKALDEQIYPGIYARLCHKLVDLQAPLEPGTEPARPIMFRTVILQRVQHYFEKTEREEQEADKEKKDAENDPVVVGEKMVNAKRHYLGNIRFISELYELGMLTDKVILICFRKLLPKRTDFEDADEEKMEGLCKLLMTSAHRLYPAYAADVNFSFDQLQKMIDLKVTSSRIRFLMQDAIDLKNNNFVQRKNPVQGRKTKEEVRKEKLKELMQAKQETMTAMHQIPPPTPQVRSSLGPNRSRLPPAHMQGLKSVRTLPGGVRTMQGTVGEKNNRQADQPPMGDMRTVASKPSKFLSVFGQDRSGVQGGPTLTLGPSKWAKGGGALNPSRTSGSVLFGSGMDNRSATNCRENSMSRAEQRNSLTNTPDMRGGTPTLSMEPSSNLSSPQMTPAATPRTGSPVNLSIPDEAVEDLVSVPDGEVEDLGLNGPFSTGSSTCGF